MRVTRAPLSTMNNGVMGPVLPHDRSRTFNPSNTPAIVITFPSSLGGLVRHHSTYYVAGKAGAGKGHAPDDSVPGVGELASGRFWAQESAQGPGRAGSRRRLRFRPDRRVRRRSARRIALVTTGRTRTPRLRRSRMGAGRLRGGDSRG